MSTTVSFARQHISHPPRVPDTPYLELDIAAALERFLQLAAALPGTALHYAVKANPHPELLAALAAGGCRFDVASPSEVRAAVSAGATAETLVYSNPVKRRDHVAEAAELGVRLFVVDSLTEVEKVAAAAPASAVLCRLATSGEGSDWPLSRKYGCSSLETVEILTVADSRGWRLRGCASTWAPSNGTHARGPLRSTRRPRSSGSCGHAG